MACTPFAQTKTFSGGTAVPTEAQKASLELDYCDAGRILEIVLPMPSGVFTFCCSILRIESHEEERDRKQ